MKKILYFLIGFLIPILFASLSYASLDGSSYSGFLGYFETIDEGVAAVYAAAASEGLSGAARLRDDSPYGIVADKDCNDDGTPEYYLSSLYDISGASVWWNFCYLIPNGPGDLCNYFNQDSDGDGIPDDIDMYPNDTEPYSVRLTSYQTIDGSSSGERVRECYETDRGDSFCIGADYNENLTSYLEFNGTWKDPQDTPVGTSEGMSDKDSQEDIQQAPFTSSAPTGDAPASNDPAFENGTISTGSETDNEALRGIMDNTGKIASNTSRQGDYMKELTRAIQNMDRNIAASSQGNTQDEVAKMQDEAEAETAQNNFENLSVSDYYSGISGDITEGEDYDSPGELSEESFFTSFFNSNPLITAFNNSGFESTSSTSSMTLSLPGLGIHQLDLIDLQPGLAAFGNLLFAFCSLGSLIMIVRG